MFSPHTNIPQVRLVPHALDPSSPRSPTTEFLPDFQISPTDLDPTHHAYSIVLLSISPHFYTTSQITTLYPDYTPPLTLALSQPYHIAQEEQQSIENGYKQQQTVKSFEYSSLVQLLRHVFKFNYNTIPYVIYHHIQLLFAAVNSSTDGLYVTLDFQPFFDSLTKSSSSSSLAMAAHLNNAPSVALSGAGTTPLNNNPQEAEKNNLMFIMLLLITYYQEIIKLIDMKLPPQVILHAVMYHSIQYGDDHNEQQGKMVFEQHYCLQNVIYYNTTVDFPYLLSNNYFNADSMCKKNYVLPPRTNFQCIVLPLYNHKPLESDPKLSPTDIVEYLKHHHITAIVNHIQSTIFAHNYDHYTTFPDISKTNTSPTTTDILNNPHFSQFCTKMIYKCQIPIQIIAQTYSALTHSQQDELSDGYRFHTVDHFFNALINNPPSSLHLSNLSQFTPSRLFYSIIAPLGTLYETIISYQQSGTTNDNFYRYSTIPHIDATIPAELLASGLHQETFHVHNYSTRIHDYSCLGGTFDHIHTGHFLLLFSAVMLSTKGFIIGMTSPALLTKKTLPHLIEPWYKRVFLVLSMIQLINHATTLDLSDHNQTSHNTHEMLYAHYITTLIPFNSTSDDPTISNLTVYMKHPFSSNNHYRVVIEPLIDMYGPSVTYPEINCLVVSEEVRKGGGMVNDERVRRGLSPTSLFVVPLLVLPTACKIQSDVPGELLFVPSNGSLYKVSSTDFRQFYNFILQYTPSEEL